QLHYFRQIAARHFDAGTNVILCTAKPAWLPPRRHGDDAMSNLKYFDDTVVREYGGRVRAYLAGDNHHYARYYSADGVQRITCGGGGAYII
ncbi:MAG: metallophosphoesterase, partial [Gammaproteobacteria bacterium]|nr:metallophosphoesterase [Gemmatimonadota bacterium]NIU72152.1 metallophosphoesterase [Gammaproteobacteria bacterium]